MRRIGIFIIILSLILNTMAVTSVAATEEETYAGNQLKILGVLKGYPDGSLKLDNTIMRSEVAALTVRMLGYGETVIVGNARNFPDVPKDSWAYVSIENAYKLGLIKGNAQGEFKPNDDITLAEVVTIMINALGENKNLVGSWPDNYMNKGKELGIIPANNTLSPSTKVTRGQMAVIIWNTLLVEKK